MQNPIAVFERKHPTVDSSLLKVATMNLATLSPLDEKKQYLRMKQAAEDGSAFAMCMCANWPNVHGRGRTPEIEYYRWSEAAAQLGYPPGLYMLAECFEKAIGVDKDLKKALDLYERSSEGGFAFAIFRLGRAYMDGALGVKDTERAIHLVERAYLEGEGMAAHQMGEWYESGEGLTKDLAIAAMWYERASEMGEMFSTLRLQMAYVLGNLGMPRDAAIASRYEARLREQTNPSEPKLN